jgi:drug/metabolite transporter (DMT)-like permease
MASTPQINKSMSGFEWTMVVILSIVWGGSFFFQGVAVKELPPLTIVFLRVALATSVLLFIMAVSGVKFPKSQKV